MLPLVKKQGEEGEGRKKEQQARDQDSFPLQRSLDHDLQGHKEGLPYPQSRRLDRSRMGRRMDQRPRNPRLVVPIAHHQRP